MASPSRSPPLATVAALELLGELAQALAEVEARIKEDLARLQNAQWLGRGALTGH